MMIVIMTVVIMVEMLDRQDSWVYVKVGLVAMEMAAAAVAATTTMDMDIMVKANLLHRPMYVETEREHLTLTAKTWLIKYRERSEERRVGKYNKVVEAAMMIVIMTVVIMVEMLDREDSWVYVKVGLVAMEMAAAAVAATTTMDMDIMVKANLLHRPMYVETEREHLTLTAKTWLIKYRE